MLPESSTLNHLPKLTVWPFTAMKAWILNHFSDGETEAQRSHMTCCHLLGASARLGMQLLPPSPRPPCICHRMCFNLWYIVTDILLTGSRLTPWYIITHTLLGENRLPLWYIVARKQRAALCEWPPGEFSCIFCCFPKYLQVADLGGTQPRAPGHTLRCPSVINQLQGRCSEQGGGDRLVECVQENHRLRVSLY